MMILYVDVKTAFVDLQYNLLGAFAPYVFSGSTAPLYTIADLLNRRQEYLY